MIKKKFCLNISMMLGVLFSLSAANHVFGLDNAQRVSTVSETEVDYAEIAPPGKLDRSVEPIGYKVDYVIDPRQDNFSGKVTIEIQINKKLDHFFLHGQQLNVSNVEIAFDTGKKLKATYQQVLDSGVAVIKLPETVPAGKAALSIEYSAAFNRNLAGLYRVDQGDKSYVMTQFQVIDARRAFPGFDEPGFKVPFYISITAPEGQVVSASTPIQSSLPADQEGFTTYKFEPTPPLPTYLLAMAVGPYDLVEYDDIQPNKVRDYAIPLRGLAPSGQKEYLEFALKNTEGMFEVLENYFDIPFAYRKLDLLAAPDFAFGAMENVGLIIYRNYFLLMNENAPLRQKRAYAHVHSHELAHQWFGNFVTPIWWDDLWLNESFATWMGIKAVDLWNPEYEFARHTLKGSIRAMSLDSLSGARKIREPITRSETVIDAADPITYNKGGGVLSMIESYLGEEVFRKGVRHHMHRFEHGVASASDFFQSLSESSGDKEIIAAFRSFVEQPGVPLLKISREEETLIISQERYTPLGSKIDPSSGKWTIPFCIRFLLEKSSEELCKMITKGTTKLTLPKGTKAFMPNANGAGYYRFALNNIAWQALIQNLAALNAKEALTFADSIEAAFRAGLVSSDIYIKGVEALARRSEWDVATAPIPGLVNFHQHFIDSSTQESFYNRINPIYSELFNKAQLANNRKSQLLADSLRSFMLFTLEKKPLREKYISEAKEILQKEPFQLSDIPNVNIFPDQLSVLVQEDSDFAVPIILDRLGYEHNPFMRSAFISSLGFVNGDMADAVRQAVIGNTINGREIQTIIKALLISKDQGERTWTWFQNNFATIVSQIPAATKSGAPMIASGFCDRNKKNIAVAFFNENADLISGYERSSNLMEEQIALCVALKDIKSQEFKKMLSSI